MRQKILKLRNEINCRIEHGAESGGHLDYVQAQLDKMLAEDDKFGDAFKECFATWVNSGLFKDAIFNEVQAVYGLAQPSEEDEVTS